MTIQSSESKHLDSSEKLGYATTINLYIKHIFFGINMSYSSLFRTSYRNEFILLE